MQNTDNNKGNAIKNPEDWTTGDEPMTEAQRSYLHTLAGEAQVKIDENMTKAEASKKIEELQGITGRGKEKEVILLLIKCKIKSKLGVSAQEILAAIKAVGNDRAWDRSLYTKGQRVDN